MRWLGDADGWVVGRATWTGDERYTQASTQVKFYRGQKVLFWSECSARKLGMIPEEPPRTCLVPNGLKLLLLMVGSRS